MLRLWYKEKIGGIFFLFFKSPHFYWSTHNPREEESLTETLNQEKMRRNTL